MRVEVPLLIVKIKAVESIIPVPSLALNAGSFKVTVSAELSCARSSLVIIGASLSLNVTLFLSCSIFAELPDASNTALSTIKTERTSVPLGSPLEPIPSVNVLPVLDILVGNGDVNTIVSPVTENTKSLFSRSPLPSPLLNTASEKSIDIVLLSAARDSDLISGGALSLSLSELKLCVVLALLPVESKIAPALGLKVKVSDPSAKPSSLIPKLYVFPTFPTLSGYALSSLALPPVTAKTKSLVSIFPVASAFANTGSLNVTEITLLLGAKALAVYCGTN